MSDEAARKEHGPWDVTEVDGPEGRLDFGALWIRGVDGLQVQAQVAAFPAARLITSVSV